MFDPAAGAACGERLFAREGAPLCNTAAHSHVNWSDVGVPENQVEWHI